MEAGDGASEPPEPKGLLSCPWLPSTPRRPNSTVQHPIYGNWAESGPSNPVPRRGVGQVLGDLAGNPALRRGLGQVLGDSAGNAQCQAAPASYSPANVVGVSRPRDNSVYEENLSSFYALQAQADRYPARDLSGVSFQTLMSLAATVGTGSSGEATFGDGLNVASVPTGGRSVPCMPFDLNSSPEAMITDAAFSKNVPYLFEPITTPQRTDKGEYQQESSRVKEAEKHNIMEPNGNKEKLHRIIDQSPAGTSAQLQENHKLDKGGMKDVDFLKTPQPKARRKKHRPKVIIEGQKKSTPKATAKPPSVKRKYVRKKGVSDPSVEEISGIGSTEAPMEKSKYTRRKGANKLEVNLDKEPLKTTDAVGPKHTRSCRKSLNFNLADQVGDESPSHSMNQLQEDNSLNMDPLKDNSMLGGDRTLQTRGKCQIVFPNDEETNTVQFSMNPGSQMILRDSVGSNACSTPEREVRLLKRRNMGTVAESEIWKRDETRMPYKFMLANLPIFSQNAYGNNGSSGYHFPTIYKKKRTEKGHNMVESSSQQTQLTSEKYTRLDIHSLGGSFTSQIASVTNQGSSSGQCQITSLLCTDPGSAGTQNGQLFLENMLALRPTEIIRKKRSKIPARPRNLASLLEICGRLQPSTSRVATTSSMKQKITFLHEPLSCMEALAANTRLTLTKKKRSKRRMVINSPPVQNLYNHQKPTTTSMGPPLALTWRYTSPADPVEYIVGKFNRLALNEKIIQASVAKRIAFTAYKTNYPEQNAIVPYQGSGVVVPFDGSFDHIKRKRPRAKVDLDDETTKVWKLLLENINNEGIDGTDEEKAKWWEEERRVFSGRANSFIARMHLVLGDRRFSEWNGSVTDSIVGVFLTQNVSDHLSSSAFISMAARFPIRPKTQSSDLNEVEVQTEEVCGLDPDVTFRLKSNIINQSDCDQVMSHETIANKSSSLIEDGRDAEDIFSSQNSSDSPVAQTVERSDSCLPITLEEPTADVDANVSNNSTSFVRLLQMTDTVLHGVYEGSDKTISGDDQKAQPKRLKNDLQNEGHLTNHVFPAETIAPSGMSTFCYVPNSGSQGTVSDLSKQKDKFFNLNDNEERPVDISGLSSESGSGTTFQKVMDVNFEGGPKSLSEHATSSNNGQGEINKESQVPILSLFQEKQKMHGVSNSPVYQQNLMDITGSSNNVDNSKNPERKEVNSSRNGPEKHRGKKVNGSKAKVGRPKKENGNQASWDYLRKQTLIGGTERAKTANRMDSVDWDAVRCADVSEIAETIKERGMNNMLAERIKHFLNRIVKDHGSIDLEWLRDVPPDKAKEYLLSIWGLGLKSVECVRLLTLHHLAFPVDTNVGRIAVRLGWVPLQPLPESLQLHLLEMYPVLESIQKYLWPRLCKLDQGTLYELHYQMITFGKVFCTKSKPNCNACPMKGECRHFASAFASARLALPAPEEKGIVSTTKNRGTAQTPLRRMNTLQLPSAENRGTDQIPLGRMNTLQLTSLEANQVAAKYKGNNSQPIIEEPLSPEPIIELPATPEHEYPEVSQCDIEDAFIEDPDEIPTIKLDMKEFTHNLQKIMEQNTELEEGDMSKALVALTKEAASIPVPKLKNVNRLRTEHRVYELPESHPLLEGLEKRLPDDPSPYLLAIWTPGETADSIVPPERRCSSHESEKLCTDEACSSCNSIRELNSQTVRGTILIPCRTAMRGSFPLNGTYFQVNEVFSDHESSVSPINVPRRWLWNLPRRTVYFGSSIPTIFRGLSTEDIQLCFWRGFVCVRGFDRKTRAPRPLPARFHLPASKMAKGKGKMDES